MNADYFSYCMFRSVLFFLLISEKSNDSLSNGNEISVASERSLMNN